MIPRVPPCCTLVFFCPSAPTQHPSPCCHDASSDLPWFPRLLQHFISPSVSCSVKASHLCYQLLFYFSLYHQGCLCLVPLSLRHLDTILRLRGPCHFWATFFFFSLLPPSSSILWNNVFWKPSYTLQHSAPFSMLYFFGSSESSLFSRILSFSPIHTPSNKESCTVL